MKGSHICHLYVIQYTRVVLIENFRLFNERSVYEKNGKEIKTYAEEHVEERYDA